MPEDPSSIFSNGEVDERSGSFNHELRTHYQQEPEQIVIDDCAVLDYLLGRERTARDDTLNYTYVEDGDDIENLLENSNAEILTRRSREGYQWRIGELPATVDKAAIKGRLDSIESNTEVVNLDEVEPREGFQNFDQAEHHDKVLAEFAYRENAVIATYDDDFLHFPIHYTTPGMLTSI